MTPEQRRRRAQIAARSRHSPNDPALETDRRNFKAERLESYVREIVDSAPPLSDEQRNRIAALLRPAPDVGGGRAA